jgi:hypothetical protein
MAAARTDAELAAEVTAAEFQLGAMLLPWSERSLPLEVRGARAAARLGTACALQARPTATAEADVAGVTRVLDRPAFAGARDRHPHAVGNLWERLKTWVLSLLEDNSTRSFAAGVRWGVLLLALGVAFLGLGRWWRRRQAGTERAEDRQSAVVTERLALPDDHLAKGRAHLASAPREALREGMLALLASLERRGLGRPDRAETNAELVAALPSRGASGDEAGQLEALLRSYDWRYYSLSRVDRAEAEAFLGEIERWATVGRSDR